MRINIKLGSSLMSITGHIACFLQYIIKMISDIFFFLLSSFLSFGVVFPSVIPFDEPDPDKLKESPLDEGLELSPSD
jgi:hypothetical protein